MATLSYYLLQSWYYIKSCLLLTIWYHILKIAFTYFISIVNNLIFFSKFCHVQEKHDGYFSWNMTELHIGFIFLALFCLFLYYSLVIILMISGCRSVSPNSPGNSQEDYGQNHLQIDFVKVISQSWAIWLANSNINFDISQSKCSKFWKKSIYTWFCPKMSNWNKY